MVPNTVQWRDGGKKIDATISGGKLAFPAGDKDSRVTDVGVYH